MQQVIASLYRNDVLNHIALMEFNDDINITQDLLQKILSDEGLVHAKEAIAGRERSEASEQYAACIYDKVSIIKADDEPWASMWRENYVAERYTLYQERVANGSGEVGYINRLGMSEPVTNKGSQEESVNTLNITAAEGAVIHASLPILKSTYDVVRQLAELRLEALGRYRSDFIAITDFSEYGVEVRHYTGCHDEWDTFDIGNNVLFNPEARKEFIDAQHRILAMRKRVAEKHKAEQVRLKEVEEKKLYEQLKKKFETP